MPAHWCWLISAGSSVPASTHQRWPISASLLVLAQQCQLIGAGLCMPSISGRRITPCSAGRHAHTQTNTHRHAGCADCAHTWAQACMQAGLQAHTQAHRHQHAVLAHQCQLTDAGSSPPACRCRPTAAGSSVPAQRQASMWAGTQACRNAGTCQHIGASLISASPSVLAHWCRLSNAGSSMPACVCHPSAAGITPICRQARTHARTYARTHTRTHARMHAHTPCLGTCTSIMMAAHA